MSGRLKAVKDGHPDVIRFPDVSQPKQLSLVDIHEDVVERLVHFYHLNAFLPIHCIHDSMPAQLETLGKDQTVDIIVLTVHIRSKCPALDSNNGHVAHLDTQYFELGLTSRNESTPTPTVSDGGVVCESEVTGTIWMTPCPDSGDVTRRPKRLHHLPKPKV